MEVFSLKAEPLKKNYQEKNKKEPLEAGLLYKTSLQKLLGVYMRNYRFSNLTAEPCH
jgi:hypothetical protein